MLIDNATPISRNPADPALRTLLDDLQGNILKSHAKPNVSLLFLRFTAAASQVKTWMRSLPVTSMPEQLADHAAMKAQRVLEKELDFCTLSLTKKGYEALGIPVNGFPDGSFKNGMDNTTVANDPPRTSWEEGFQQPVHALVILAHSLPAGLDSLRQRITASLTGIASIAAQEKGIGIPGEKEHFGFADSISQPRYFDDDVLKDQPSANWKPFASLNLALAKDPHGKAFNGGITGDGDFPVGDLSGDHSYGSYLVFRKLEQDVPGWNKAVVQLAKDLHQSPDLVGAYAVGRFKDGTPVTMHNTEQGKPLENDFDYGSDMAGSKCPFHAHIRKANPRGDTTRQFGVPLEEEMAHRITRRGIPYEKEGKKGLLFMCYQGSIETQFDFMQNSWVDSDGFLTDGVGIDDVIGQGTSNPKQWPATHGGAPVAKKFSFGKFVTMKGGEYFFTPSVSFLKSLSHVGAEAL